MEQETPLTYNQERFINLYLETGNATQSYLQVFTNCTYETAATEASKMLKKPHIKGILSQRAEDLKVKSNLTRESKIKELATTAQEAKANGDYASYARLQDMIIRMVGFYAPTKVEHTNFDIKLTIPGLDAPNVKTKSVEGKSNKRLELGEHKEDSEPDSTE